MGFRLLKNLSSGSSTLASGSEAIVKRAADANSFEVDPNVQSLAIGKAIRLEKIKASLPY